MKANTKLHVINNQKRHPLDIAKQAIRDRRKRLNATRGLCTAHDESRDVHSPTMNVDSVIDRTRAAQESHLGKR